MPRSKKVLCSADQPTGPGSRTRSGTAKTKDVDYDYIDEYIIADLDIPVEKTVKNTRKRLAQQNYKQTAKSGYTEGDSKCTKEIKGGSNTTSLVLIPKIDENDRVFQVEKISPEGICPPENHLPFPLLTEAVIKKEIIETDSDSESSSSSDSSSDDESDNCLESGSFSGTSDSDSDSSSSEENDMPKLKPQVISFSNISEGLSTEKPMILEPLTVLPYKGKKRGPKRKKPIKIQDPNKPMRKSPGQPWTPISCPHCKKTFRYISQLRQHSTAHSKEKPFYCDECGKSFTRNCFLEEHRACHLITKSKESKLKDTSVLCSFCQKTCSNSYELKLHLRTHTGEKPFTCHLCERSFSIARTLKIHLRRHTGDKPFKCTVKDCDKAFTVKLELQRHMSEKYSQHRRKRNSKTSTVQRMRKRIFPYWYSQRSPLNSSRNPAFSMSVL